MEHITKNHNRQITESCTEASCNCREKQTSIRRKLFCKKFCMFGHTSSYVGMTGNNIKTRYYNQFKSYINKRYKNEIELSKYIWKDKEKEVENTFMREKLRQSNT